MKKYILILNSIFVFVMIENSLMAQMDPSYRQYQFNALILNPAQAGSNGYSDISVLGTQFWIGMPGAPRTATISGNFQVDEKFGIGATVVADENGPVHSTNLGLSGAYHLRISENWKFSAGLKLSAVNYNVVTSDLQTTQINDPDMQENLTTGLSFNAGFGFLVYSKNLFFGFSKPRVAEMRFNRMDMSNFVDKKSGYTAYVGADFAINKAIDFRPSVMTLFGTGGPLSLDANAIFTFNKLVDFGISYHLKGGIGAILGLNIKDKMYIGYAYSYPLSKLNTVTVQSHELGLRLKFGKIAKNTSNPRFFN